MDEYNAPPYSKDAERSVLSSMILDNDIAIELSSSLKERNFYAQSHQLVFRAIQKLVSDMVPVDQLSLADKLIASNDLDMVGGKVAIIELASSIISTVNYASHVQIVKRDSTLRDIILCLTESTGEAYNRPDDAEALLSQVYEKLGKIDLGLDSSGDSMEDIVSRVLTGINSPDKTYINVPGVHGVHLKPGNLVVVAGGTGAGKTAVSLGWGYEWAREHKVSFFEYEMTEEELLQRLISHESGIGIQTMERGITPAQFESIMDATDRILARNIKLHDVYCDMDGLVSKIRSDVKDGCEIAVIDYIGMIPLKGSGAKAHEIGPQITHRLKRLAQELKIIIILLCQLSRDGQRNEGKNPYPKKHHLRDSGEIENDANVIIMIWQDKDCQEDERIRIRDFVGVNHYDTSFSLMRVETVKNRNGPEGHSWFKFRGECMTVEPAIETRTPNQIAKDNEKQSTIMISD